LEDTKFSALHKISVGLSKSDLEEQIKLCPHLLNQVDTYGRTALMWACSKGDLAATEILLRYGADITLKDRGGSTALHWAGNASCASAILESGFKDIDALDKWERTPLCYAIENENMELLMFYLQSGADTNIGCRCPPLVMAAGNGQANMINALLHYGANVDQRAHHDGTAVLEATEHNYADCVAILLNEGPRLDNMDKTGNDILSMAAKHGSHEIMELLANAPIEGLEMNPTKVAWYWDIFNNERDACYVGEREPIMTERTAFENLLSSVNERSETRQKPSRIEELNFSDVSGDEDSEDEFVDAVESLNIGQ
jgi:ankyrin repeat protein